MTELLADIQFSQVLSFVSSVQLDEPEKMLQLALFHRNRFLARSRDRSDAFWLSPKFKKWAASGTPSLIMIQGAHSLRAETRNFILGMVECIRTAGVPVLWALCSGFDGRARISAVDVLKYLVGQALRLRKSAPAGANRAIASQFQTATTEAEWVGLLAMSLLGQKQIYIVVDVELINERLETPLAGGSSNGGRGGLSLPAAFAELLRILAGFPDGPAVKVVLVSYGSAMFQAVDEAQREFVVPVRGALKRPVQRTAVTAARRTIGRAAIPVRVGRVR